MNNILNETKTLISKLNSNRFNINEVEVILKHMNIRDIICKKNTNEGFVFEFTNLESFNKLSGISLYKIKLLKNKTFLLESKEINVEYIDTRKSLFKSIVNLRTNNLLKSINPKSNRSNVKEKDMSDEQRHKFKKSLKEFEDISKLIDSMIKKM